MGKGTGKGGCFNHFSELAVGIQGCIVIVCCVGPVFMIVGAVLIAISASMSSREPIVDQYSNLISNFESSSASFRASNFSFEGVDFEINTSNDPLNDPGTFEDYLPFKYLLRNASLSQLEGSERVIKGNGFDITLDFIAAVDIFSLSQFDIKCRLASTDCTTLGSRDELVCLQQPVCETWCAEQNGVWAETSQTCSMTHFLNRLCYVLAQPLGDSWTLDRSNGPGCYWRGISEPGSQGNLNPTRDNKSPGIYSAFYTPSIPITLRHSSDPYLYASFQTGGSFFFGASLMSQLVDGIAVLVTGFIVTILSIVGVYFFVRFLMGTGRGQKKRFRNGGLEKKSSAGQFPLEKNLEVPKSHPPAHPPQSTPSSNPDPHTHIINIYVSQSQSSSPPPPSPSPSSPSSPPIQPAYPVD